MEQLDAKMKNISMSDYLETLVADYLENFGVGVQKQEATPEVPKKKKRAKKNDQEL